MTPLTWTHWPLGHTFTKRHCLTPCPLSCPQICDTFDVDAGRRSYYTNLFPLNPSGEQTVSTVTCQPSRCSKLQSPFAPLQPLQLAARSHLEQLRNATRSLAPCTHTPASAAAATPPPPCTAACRPLASLMPPLHTHLTPTHKHTHAQALCRLAPRQQTWRWTRPPAAAAAACRRCSTWHPQQRRRRAERGALASLCTALFICFPSARAIVYICCKLLPAYDRTSRGKNRGLHAALWDGSSCIAWVMARRAEIWGQGRAEDCSWGQGACLLLQDVKSLINWGRQSSI